MPYAGTQYHGSKREKNQKYYDSTTIVVKEDENILN